MSTRTLFYPVLLALVGFSCVSQKRHLTEVTELKQCLQREQALNDQLEAYSTRIAYKDGQIQSLKEEVSRLDEHNQELQTELNRMINTATTQQEEMERTLREKMKDLNRQEELILTLQNTVRERDRILSGVNRRLEITMKQYAGNKFSYERTDCCVRIILAGELLFAPGSYQIHAQGTETLGRLAAALRDTSGIRIEVIGHTDSIPLPRGPIRDHWDFSVLRASSVVRVLTDNYGLLPRRISAAGCKRFHAENYSEHADSSELTANIELIIEPELEDLSGIIRDKTPEN